MPLVEEEEALLVVGQEHDSEEEHQKGGGAQAQSWRLGLTALFLLLVALSAVMIILNSTSSSFKSKPKDSLLISSDEDGGGGGEPVLVRLRLVKDAEEKGALCLDGTPPGYHFLKGFDSGADNWLIHLEGGAWCSDVESCNERKYTELGSSNYMERQVPFTGILSNLPSHNPDFFNWNKVKVRYCDGASFSGDVEETDQNGTTLYFRGEHIWKAVMEELLHSGLATARKAFLTGCSAGGLASYIRCDDFKTFLPNVETVKCMADGGFFLDVNKLQGRHLRSTFDA